jgi:antirestriction protein ArdC
MSKNLTPRADLYQDVTDRIVAQFEAGCIPWVQPWAAGARCLPMNATTDRAYSGINVLMLMMSGCGQGFANGRWLTFRQALGVGGNVRKGEHGTTVFYADRYVPRSEQERGDEARSVAFLKRFTVFNVAQCENLPEEIIGAAPLPHTEAEILPRAQALLDASGADIRIGGDRAYYHIADDYIRVPEPRAYFQPIDWHRTVLHELSHWSGGEKRLARDFSGRFGDQAYGMEELVAELSSAYLCAALAIAPTVRHADYVGAWLSIMKSDKRAIFTAARLASAACDYVLAFLQPVQADSLAEAA